MNIQGAAVEALYQRPLMSTFHAFYSIGGFAGALVSGGLAAVGVAPFDRALWPAVLLGAAAIAVHQWLPSAEAHTASPRSRVRIRITRQTWPLAALGLMAFCSLLAEGASGDWSALYLHKSLGADAAFAATAFAAFSVAMAVARLSGDWLTSRLGAALLLRGGGALAAIGLTLTLLLGRPALAVAGFGLVGLGLANVVPHGLQRRRSIAIPRATRGHCSGSVRRLRRSSRRATADWLHRTGVHAHACPHRSGCVLRADRTRGADGPPRRLIGRLAYNLLAGNPDDLTPATAVGPGDPDPSELDGYVPSGRTGPGKTCGLAAGIPGAVVPRPFHVGGYLIRISVHQDRCLVVTGARLTADDGDCGVVSTEHKRARRKRTGCDNGGHAQRDQPVLPPHARIFASASGVVQGASADLVLSTHGRTPRTTTVRIGIGIRTQTDENHL